MNTSKVLNPLSHNRNSRINFLIVLKEVGWRKLPAWRLPPTELSQGVKHHRASRTCKTLASDPVWDAGIPYSISVDHEKGTVSPYAPQLLPNIALWSSSNSSGGNTRETIMQRGEHPSGCKLKSCPWGWDPGVKELLGVALPSQGVSPIWEWRLPGVLSLAPHVIYPFAFLTITLPLCRNLLTHSWPMVSAVRTLAQWPPPPSSYNLHNPPRWVTCF